MTLNLLTAMLLGLAGFSLGLRQILLSPRNATFPCAPFAVRLAMFIGAAALGYMAVRFWGEGDRPYAGQAGATVAVLAGLLALYFGAMLTNVLAQRFPAPVWYRINAFEAKTKASSVRRSARETVWGATNSPDTAHYYATASNEKTRRH
jgi:hypothetical protein